MPIRADLLHLYRAPEWQAARAAVKEKAADRCQRCNVKNGAWIVRDASKRGFTEITEADAAGLKARGERVVLIQCGACHRVPVPQGEMYALSNLLWLDRGCHLRFDSGVHRRSRQTRKDLARPLLAIGGAA